MYLIKYIELFMPINAKNKVLTCLFNSLNCRSNNYFSNAKELICMCY